MSLSISTLSAIQKAGAAVFDADAELKTAVNDYALRVNAAIASNPYSVGNDALFENWKVIARLSQSLTVIEEELKKVYHVAADMISDDQPLLVQVSGNSAAEQASQSVAATAPETDPNDMTPTDVVVKKYRKSTQPSANAIKLLAHLKSLLKLNRFTVINQTALARDIGIPLGSMTSALRQLTERGRLIAGPNSGSYKLAKSR